MTIEWDAGRPAEQLALRAFDRDRDDAARSADQCRQRRRCGHGWRERRCSRRPQRLPAARIAAALGVFSSQALVDLYSTSYDATDPDELGGTEAWQLRLAFIGKDQDARLAAMRTIWGNAESPLDRVAAQVLLARAARRVVPNADLQVRCARPGRLAAGRRI